MAPLAWQITCVRFQPVRVLFQSFLQRLAEKENLRPRCTLMEKRMNTNSLVYIRIFAARAQILAFGSLAWPIRAYEYGNPEITTAAQLDVERLSLA